MSNTISLIFAKKAVFGSALIYVLRDETGDEVVRLLDAISTNVTSFYREPEHFDFIAMAVEEWADKGQNNFRFWSAACSTGEEPYSLGITVLETLKGSGSKFKILATDISTKVLETGKKGQYKKENMAAISPMAINRYFNLDRGEKGAFYTAKDELKRMITFARLNLSAPPFPMSGPFDAVFCRNVMIYFDIPHRERLVGDIHNLLKPNGYLFIGYYESLAGVKTGFTAIKPSIYTHYD